MFRRRLAELMFEQTYEQLERQVLAQPELGANEGI